MTTPVGSGWNPESVALAVGVLGRRWVPQILHELRDGPLRRHVLRERLGVSDKVLTETLRALEREGLVARHVIATVPAQVTYQMTDIGRGTEAPLATLSMWWNQLRHGVEDLNHE